MGRWVGYRGIRGRETGLGVGRGILPSGFRCGVGC
jgi:hypothetical protein